jgi:choline dehydrogenase
MRIGREIMSQLAMQRYKATEVAPGPQARSDDEILGFIREAGYTQYHPTCSCRMGVDERAVVDPQLRVRGIRGLRVVDASIMPTIVSGNTNATSIMIGEKGADLILGRAARAEAA